MTDQFPHIRVFGACRKLGPTIEFQREGMDPIIYQPGPVVDPGDMARNAATRFAESNLEWLKMYGNISVKYLGWFLDRLNEEQKQAEAAQ